jgi:hypothetical protein
MKKVIVLVLLLYPAVAGGQPVQQSGNVTPGHVPVWITNGVVGDGGTAAQGALSSLGITASGPSFCINSDLTSAAGWQQFCFGVTTAGGGTISVKNFGTAPAEPLNITVNGTNYNFPFVASGIIGPNSTTVGDLALWNNTSGTLLKDAAMSGDVTMNGSGVTSLASVVTAGGPTGSATTTPIITYDAKGRLTLVSVATIAPPWSAITGTPTTLAGYGITSPLPYAQGGCNATTQAGCTNNLFPTPTRAGDIPYWNGTTWLSVAGNNSGNACLQETSVGAPSWTPCNFTAGATIYNVVAAYGAKRNYLVLLDGAMSGASTTLTSASAHFASGDVGKYIAVAGAGAGGITLYTTIATFVNLTTITLTSGNISGGAISGKIVEYGNDDAPEFQTAWNACVTGGGGTVYVPVGSYFVSQLNMANTQVSCVLKGEGPQSTRIFPLEIGAYGTANGHVFDMTGSAFIGLTNFQFGAYYTLAVPTTGIAMMQVASNVSNRMSINHVYFSGQYSGTTFYDYGVPSLYTISDSDFYNYFPGAGTHNALYLTSTNILSYTSSFATVTSGTISTSDILFSGDEFHKFAGTGADNSVVLLDGVGNVHFLSGVISGGATTYVWLNGTNGTLGFLNVTMETEGQPVEPTYEYYSNSATWSQLSDPLTTAIVTTSKYNVAVTTNTETFSNH